MMSECASCLKSVKTEKTICICHDCIKEHSKGKK